MIRYLDPLYTTDKTADKCKKVRNNLRIGKGMVGLYLITIAETESDVLDIINISLFKQRYFRHRNIDVVGLAENKDAAFELVRRIHTDYFNVFGTYLGIKDELKSRLDMQEKTN